MCKNNLLKFISHVIRIFNNVKNKIINLHVIKKI